MQVFSHQQIEANLKADRVTDEHKIKQMQKVLYKNMREPEEEEQNAAGKYNQFCVNITGGLSGISDERLHKLLEQLELNEGETELTREESHMFEEFVKSQQTATLKEWHPWWLSTDNKPSCIDIQEVETKDQIDETLNLNELYEDETFEEAKGQEEEEK